MKHNHKTALGLVVALTMGAATAFPAYASGNHGQAANAQNMQAGNAGGHGGAGGMMGGQGAGMGGQGGMMGGQGAGMGGQGGMMGGQGAGMGGQGGMMQMMQMMKQMHGQMAGGSGGMMGGMGGGQMGGMANLLGLSADGEGLQVLLEEYDADGNGTLSIAEFEVAHSASIREAMVDRFQALDNDGDGQITAEEITAQMGRMQNMMGAQAGEAKAADGAGMGMNMDMGAQNGEMMQNQGN